MAPRRIAVVTGGNRGIGFEICRELAQLQHHVVLTARDQAKARRIPEDDRAGQRAYYHRAKMNSAARTGAYAPAMEREAGS